MNSFITYISIFFSLLGILSFEKCIYIGAILTTLEYVLGKINGQLKNLTGIFIAISIGAIISLFNNYSLISNICFLICCMNIFNIIVGYLLLNDKKKEVSRLHNISSSEETKLTMKHEVEKIVDEFDNCVDTEKKIGFFYKTLMQLFNAVVELYAHTKTLCWNEDFLAEYYIKLSNMDIFLEAIEKMYNFLRKDINIKLLWDNEIIQTKNVIDDFKDLNILYSKGLKCMEIYITSGGTDVNNREEINQLSNNISLKYNNLNINLQELRKVIST